MQCRVRWQIARLELSAHHLAMRRVLLVMIAMTWACMDSSLPLPDPDATPACVMPRTTFCVEVGRACDADTSQFCAGGMAWCAAGHCRAFCAEASPRCPDGTLEHHSATDGGDLCVCAP